ncbi:MAG: Hpt domain-containing protein, partial [Proteobacteria bacterium]|nr:Hpt domain-containing protein [Pseudomonadota bacterium]
EFLRDQRTVAEAIRDALRSGDSEGAQRLAHTLKGAAANLGMPDLAQAAGDLETALRQGKTDVSTNARHHLATRLTVVVASLDSLDLVAPSTLPKPSTPSAARPAKRPAARAFRSPSRG